MKRGRSVAQSHEVTQTFYQKHVRMHEHNHQQSAKEYFRQLVFS